jgi:hypothetical protein
MTITVRQATGLLAALRNGSGGAARRAHHQLNQHLETALRDYQASVTKHEPDLPSWEAPYAAAFAQADSAARWAIGAATANHLADTPTPFDPSQAAFDALVERCNAALAAVRAPANGRPAMARMSTLLQDSLAALQNAYGAGSPAPTAAQVAAEKALAVVVHECAAFCGAMGISWTPAA